MATKIPKGLKITFLVHFVVSCVLGLLYLVIPVFYLEFIGWGALEIPIYRVVGASMIAFGVSSLLAWKAETWEKVEIVVELEIVWTVLADIALIWGMLVWPYPLIGWLYVGIMIAFTVLFIYFKIKQQTS
ncbi:MAG: hypothetical protein ACFFD2_19175 [Promethearchaeota archaeon]